MTGDDIGHALASLARGEEDDLLEFIPRFDEVVDLDGLRSRVSTHFIAHDANSVPAVDMLARSMARAAVDFCVPRDKIRSAQDELTRTGSSSAFVDLSAQARELFVSAETSGEGGELLLFLLMERLMKLPQILSKMSLKTSSQMHVHGSDGVHARLGDDGILDVFWGESKLYASSSSAFKECIESIAPFLAAADDERKRDLLLIRDHLNVDQQQVAAHLIEYFDPSSAKRLKLRWNGVCLIGFDKDSYPNVSVLADKQREELRTAITRWNASIGARIIEHELQEVNIDVFCLPVPSVKELRASVLKALGAK